MHEKRRLGQDAYGGVSGEAYKPYVPAGQSMAEFTVRSVVIGSVIGIVFGAANAYLGLKVSMTVSASIPAAIIAIAVGRAFRQRTTILENNMAQTIGSSGEALAAGVIFTVPALIVLGFMPELSRIFVLSVVGGLLGILLMIPLRRQLIVREHGKLSFPEGTACAEVLVAGDAGGQGVKRVMLGLGLGGVYQFLMEGFGLWATKPSWNVRGVPGAEIGGEVSPALVGVGYVLGPRIAGIMLSGGALAWLVIIPIIKMIGEGRIGPIYPATVPIDRMAPTDIWNNYIRYIGAGAVAFGGLVTLVRALPTIGRSFAAGFREITRRGRESEVVPRTDRDIPMKFVVLGAIAVAVSAWLLPQIPVNVVGALLIVVFGFFFVTVSSRIVGVVGSSSNPASGMTIATLLATSLVFLGMGWTGPEGMVAAVSVGAVVCIAICMAADASQDLKTGHLVGATPWLQQIGEVIGVLATALLIGWVVFFLNDAYGIGSEKLPAPQAVLMSMVVKGVLTQSLPWTLVFIGAFLAACVEILGVSSLPFAVGLYLPVHLSTPIMIGGIVRHFIERTRDADIRHERRERGVLFASGLIAGGALVGILVAVLVSAGIQERINVGTGWAGAASGLAALLAFLLLTVALALSAGLGDRKHAPESPPVG
jgi:putative OPT family oligopeptide transporter